jgi:hypothetical protein
MLKNQPFDIEIDKLTRSIENAISGDSFKTLVLELTAKDIKSLKQSDWVFDWKTEAKQKDKTVYKLVIADNETVFQGLISLQDKGDHIFMHLIESNRFNRGAKKLYIGVPGNLVAFACKLSFDKGYEGYVSFESKTRLIEHYQLTLGAHVLFGNIMAINRRAAHKLIDQYFPENL